MKSLNLLFIFLVLFTAESNAVEITVYTGTANLTALSGCCSDGGSQFGGGAIGRFRFDDFGEVEFAGFSTGKFNQGLVLKPFYLMGRPIIQDDGGSDFVNVQTISNLRWISSVGAGFFTLNANTKRFDLPALVTGISLTNMNQFIYSFNDRWAVAGLLELTAGVSGDSNNFILGTYLGLSYNFH